MIVQENARIAVIIASLGRPETLEHILRRLSIQTRRPDIIVLSVEKDTDLPGQFPEELCVRVVSGPRGSSAQRNRALDSLDGIDIVAFFDDDYVPSKFAIEGILRGFSYYGSASGLCGLLCADGAKGSGISIDDANGIIDERDSKYDIDNKPSILKGFYGVYGCNMAFRIKDIGNIRFDEQVPLYGWLEDTDFGARLPGPVIYTDSFYGVHCASKIGKEGHGRRFGYSQIMNPAYFCSKGTIKFYDAFILMIKPTINNAIRYFNPEPWIDRPERFKGNLAALRDLIHGNLNPSKIKDL